MKLTIGGRSFDIEATFNEGRRDHVARGLTIFVKCSDGVRRDGTVIETTTGVTCFQGGNDEELQYVLEWAHQKMHDSYLTIAGVAARICPKCPSIASTPRTHHQTVATVKCANGHDVSFDIQHLGDRGPAAL